MPGRRYTIPAGPTSLAASTTIAAVQLANGSSDDEATIIGIDITFDSVATGAGALPVLVKLVRPTAAGSGGSTVTPTPVKKGGTASKFTARKGDTTPGASPALVKQWYVQPVGGLVQSLPMGREVGVLGISDFLELVLVSGSGFTTCNYVVNVEVEE